jgi:hypothetical protein
VHASERLSLTYLGKASRGKPRRKPELGNPTFRDCRGASGNVAMVELGTHFASESARLVTLHLQLARPRLYRVPRGADHQWEKDPPEQPSAGLGS